MEAELMEAQKSGPTTGTNVDLEELLSDLDVEAQLTCHHPMADNG